MSLHLIKVVNMLVMQNRGWHEWFQFFLLTIKDAEMHSNPERTAFGLAKLNAK